MVQSNGGGIGVVDIDNDGWPDLYFTQGGSWPSSTPPTGPSDQLFRNFGGKVFRNATESSGLVDCNFGQGVTVGDLNGDGFDEIYVANVGGNRLFQNNGDGTLSDISVESELAGNEWSTSCAMNDFNLDGHLDLYVVNYLSFDDAATEICHEGDKLRSCRTEGFEAAEDRLYLNGGDGSFMDVSVSSGVQQPNGRGLGIITADFDGDHYPDVFVGNDAVPNFLFLNRCNFRDTSHTAAVQSLSGNAPATAASELDQGIVRFEELAVQRGIATDDSGRSQACMGVAFADFDLDRHDDIFVTNFYNEPNTLYLGQTDGMFIDRTRSFQLSSPSIPMLGFGTQALDADLDGDQDLVVLNGHLDDLSAKGVPFQMQPQVFENQAGKWFVERQLDCPFFRAQHIGRSLARLDWNNDGREDLAAGLLGEPYELLTNVSQTFGGWVGLQLVGTTTSRNAPGAIVTIHNGEASTSRQLASGSGFQASNQHRLMIAIRDKPEDNAVKISIRWANGEECVLNDVSINQTYFVVQPRTQTSLPLRAFALPM